MLSVSGLRGIVGTSLTAPVAERYAAAFGQWLKAMGARDVPHVVVGRDTRPSGQMIETAATAGLLGVGCRVTQLGVVSTPGTAVMNDHLRADGGLVITASHNPVAWNGIKVLRSGVAPPADEISHIIDRFQRDPVEPADVERFVPVEENNHSDRVHIDRILAQIDVELVWQRRFKVVVDSVCGAGGSSAAMLANELGVELIHINADPTGRFPHPPEPTRENLTELCTAVQIHQADIGFAQDPDADRLAMVDERGHYLGEEYTLALCWRHLLLNPSLTNDPLVLVANLSTSRMIDDIAVNAQSTVREIRVVRCPVGEANVASAMSKHLATIGGEGNGGIILPRICRVRDSLTAMALILELLACSKRPLSWSAQQFPSYVMIKEKLESNREPAEALNRLKTHFKGEGRQIDMSDGIRIDWPHHWVHVRPSNTEPIWRVIAEAADESTSQKTITAVRQVLGCHLP